MRKPDRVKIYKPHLVMLVGKNEVATTWSGD